MLLLLALLAGVPDFTASRFEAPATAREGDVVEYRLTVLNSGEAPSLYLEAKVRLPARALRVAGDLPYDPVERTFQGPLALGPGEQRELRFRVLEAACEVIDTTAPPQVERTRGGGTMASFTPLVAVRFTDRGVERVGAGFDGPSRLRIGGGRDLLDETQATFRVGARVTCWYDPDDPSAIVVKRGPGGAYAFALLPLGLLLAALAALRSAFVR